MKKILSFTLVALLATPLIVSAHGPSRQKVVEKIVINAPVDKVWAVVGDFSSIGKWLPAVKSVKMLDDKTRQLTLNAEGGPSITENLKKRDEENKMMKYKIVKQDIVKTEDFRGKTFDVPAVPVKNYLSIMRLSAVDGGTEVSWIGKFYRVYQLNYYEEDPRWPEGLSDEDAVKTITAIYKSGLQGLKKLVEGQ